MIIAFVCAVFTSVVTAGWENVCPTRYEIPPVEVLWRADFSNQSNFKVELCAGAEGEVVYSKNSVRIRKTNSEGHIIVRAKPFAIKKGRRIRFSADQTSNNSDVLASNGFLRYHGRKESLLPSKAEGDNFWVGGSQTMRSLACTAPGMRYRKYAQYLAEDDIVTALIVVSGEPSESEWSNWLAEDVRAANQAWRDYLRTRMPGDHTSDMIDENVFDEMLARDSHHTAEVRRIDGVSRLLVDGEISAPVAFRAKGGDQVDKTFAGKSLDGSAIKLMLVNIPFGGKNGFCTPAGFDAKGAVRVLKRTMRMAPNSLFMVALTCNAYPDFTLEEHPDEVWILKNGKPLYGNGGSCIADYGGMDGRTDVWPWVSMFSPSWRSSVKKYIRELVAELKRQGLDKRVVGAHICGYHDGQFTVAHADYSPMAQAAYRKYIASPECISTNYIYFAKQAGFWAEEEFAREFKCAMGKPSVVAVWCENPLGSYVTCAVFLTEFTRSDAVDVIIPQPDYRERFPAHPTVPSPPMDSLHLHGKMFWWEFDLRTYAAPDVWEKSWPSMKGLGFSQDFPMWQTIYRKHAGVMDAMRMGYWFYDIGGGWFEAPEIALDIRALVAEECELARIAPSKWRPDVAVVIDEANFVTGRGQGGQYGPNGEMQVELAKACESSGVPTERFLAEDAIAKPELLNGKKLVVLSFFRDIDERREALLQRLASQGTTLVFLSETAIRRNAKIVGFEPMIIPGAHSHHIVPELGVTDTVVSTIRTLDLREWGMDFRNAMSSKCTVKETEGIRVLARYANGGEAAIAERKDSDCRRIYVCEPGSLTSQLFNRWSRESGAYVALLCAGAIQLSMNGDFMAIHCLRPGEYDIKLPFVCKVKNLKSGKFELSDGRSLKLCLTAGQSCRFRLLQTP